MPLSYSQLASYKSCPRKYEYAFIKKLKQPLTPEGCFGVSVHSTLSKWGKEEMRKCDKCADTKMQQQLFEEGRLVTHDVDLSMDTLFSFWHESFVHAGYASKVAADFDRARGEILMGKFYAWWKQEERKVVAVEKGFVVKSLEGCEGLECYEGLEVSGRFDRVEEKADGTLRIIDFKTGGLRLQESVDADLQLSIYAMAAQEVWGKEVSELVMIFLCDEELTEVVTQRSEGELQTASKTIALLSERIGSQDYAPTPSVKVCRGCPYRRVCDASAV